VVVRYVTFVKAVFLKKIIRTMGRLRRRWEDNIKMDLQDKGCGVRDWIELAQDRDRRRAVVNAGSIKCGEFLD
jgi:hypothetical protein